MKLEHDVEGGQIVKIGMGLDGVEPNILIKGKNNLFYLLTVNPERRFVITCEGAVGDRYDSKGNWVAEN